MATVTEKPPTLSAAELVREHQAGVWRYLRFLGCQDSQCDDLTQETFLAVLRKPLDQRSPRATAAYLRTVARNKLLMSLRKAGREPANGFLEAAEDVWAKLADDGGGAYLDALDDCLTELTDRVRRAVEMRYRDGSSRQEMAAELEMTEQGIKTLLRRAREQLRRCVEGKVES